MLLWLCTGTCFFLILELVLLVEVCEDIGDQKHMCPVWAQGQLHGACLTADYLRTHCRKSCNLCTSGKLYKFYQVLPIKNIDEDKMATQKLIKSCYWVILEKR